MAYAQPWNNATPDGAVVLASDIDLEIRNLKVAIDERMQDLVGAGNWANDGVDPKEIQPASIAGAGTPAAGYFEVQLDISPLSVVGTDIAPWTVVYDPGGFAVTPNEFTIPTDGDYEVCFQCMISESTADINVTGSWKINGLASVAAQTVSTIIEWVATPILGGYVHTIILPFTAGDTIVPTVFNFGSANAILSANSTHLTIKRLGIV
jgi:hypothetical protein